MGFRWRVPSSEMQRRVEVSRSFGGTQCLRLQSRVTVNQESSWQEADVLTLKMEAVCTSRKYELNTKGKTSSVTQSMESFFDGSRDRTNRKIQDLALL